MKSGLNRYITTGNAALYLSGAAVALALKCFYSRATADDLLWILYPVTLLVELLTGRHFERETYAGFVDHSHGITIAPACSGVNFLIIAFCTALFPLVHRVRAAREKWLWFGIALAGSYLLTVAVNSLRIVLSIYLIEHEVHHGWLTPERIHRIEGVVVYCIFLSIFYLTARRAAVYIGLTEETGADRETMHDSRKSLSVFTPLAWYILITLLVPIARGTHDGPGSRFNEHFWTVGLASLAVFLALYSLRLYSRRIMFNIESIVGRYTKTREGARQKK